MQPETVTRVPYSVENARVLYEALRAAGIDFVTYLPDSGTFPVQQLMAADPIRIKRIAFGISIATASIAGALLIVIQPVEPSVGREYIGRVFAICVLGGLGSLPGTMIGAILLGIVESFTATFYGPSWAPAVAFGVLLLTLAFRPAGLLGR